MMTMSKSSQEKILQSSVAMTVTLISFGMLFASMFLGYVLVRFNTPVWPPFEIQGMPTLLPFLSTIVMGLSSLTYIAMEKREHQRKLFWLATFLLGGLFLALQWTLWGTLKQMGFFVGNGSVTSMVYAFTWVHAAHILMGLGAIVWLGFYIFKRPSELTVIKLMNVGKFWHFLGVVWLMMYLMLFVL